MPSIRQPDFSAAFGLRTLRIQEQAVSRSLERLATGRRINRASDDPAGSVVLTVTGARKQAVAGLISGIEQERLLNDTASDAYSLIADRLISLQSLLTQGANTGASTEEEREALQLEVDGILDAIDGIANGTTFKDKKLLAGEGVLLGSSVSTRLDARTTNLGQTIAQIEVAPQPVAAGSKLGAAGTNPKPALEYIEVALADLRTGGPLSILDGDTSLAQGIVDAALSQVSKAAGNFDDLGLGAQLSLLQKEFESLSELESTVGDTDFAKETSELARSQVLATAALSVILINRETTSNTALGLLG